MDEGDPRIVGFRIGSLAEEENAGAKADGFWEQPPMLVQTTEAVVPRELKLLKTGARLLRMFGPTCGNHQFPPIKKKGYERGKKEWSLAVLR